MNKPTKISRTRRNERALNAASGGLSVRTNLRAGVAFDDLDDMWGKWQDAVSKAASNATGQTTSTTTS